MTLDRSPFATGDALVNDWGGKTDLGIYGASHVGYLAALVGRTNHQRILQLDLLATDFFHEPAYPTYLYFNPDRGGSGRADRRRPRGTGSLRNHTPPLPKPRRAGATTFRLPGDSAAVIVVAPADGKVRRDGKKMSIDGTVVDFATMEDK